MRLTLELKEEISNVIGFLIGLLVSYKQPSNTSTQNFHADSIMEC